MSSGDRKVVVFIQGQADSEKARLDHLVRERKMSILKGSEKGSGEGGWGGQDGEKEGEKGEGFWKGWFWKGLGRRIKKSFSVASGDSK